MNKVREVYGKKRDKKASIKLARELFDRGEISNDDFNALALEGVLGPAMYQQIITIIQSRL